MHKSKISKFLREFEKLVPDEIELNSGLSIKDINQAEKKLGIILPDDLKSLYQITNGLYIAGSEILPLSSANECNLVAVSNWEHIEAEYSMPSNLIPFAPNGRGDHYCVDLNTRNRINICKVVFWQWDYSPFNLDSIEVTNHNLLDWLKEEAEDVL